MNRILHIFRKDTRRFWPEILLTLGVTAGLVLATPATWRQSMYTGQTHERQLASALQFLVPLSWWLLLARVVHAESLVGENQAWLTRPYEWPKLLAAKALFCIAYVWVPLLIAQCLLLRMAGFAPNLFATGLAYGGLVTAQEIVLPLFAIAAVTSNFARMTLTLLGLILGMVGLSWVALIFLRGNMAPGIPYLPSHWIWHDAGTLAFLVGIVVLQYALRRTRLTRGLLLAAAAVLGLAMLHQDHPNVDAAYPRAESGHVPALKATFAPEPDSLLEASASSQHPGQIQFQVPVEFDGVPEGYAAEIDMLQASVDAPGTHWQSAWQEAAWQIDRFVPGLRHASIWFDMTQEMYRKLRGQTVDLRIALAISRLKAVETTQTTYLGGELALSGTEICATVQAVRIGTLLCRYAPEPRGLTYLTAAAREASCASTAGAMPHLTGSAWLGRLGDGRTASGLSPVSTEELELMKTTDEGRYYNGPVDAALCPGTAIGLTKFRLDGRTREELVVRGFVVPAKLVGEL